MRIAILSFVALLLSGCEESRPEPQPLIVPAGFFSQKPAQVDSAGDASAAGDAEGMSWEHQIAGSSVGEIAITLPAKVIVIATATAVSNHMATNGDPPVIVFSVKRTLLGGSVPESIQVIWEPPPHDVDYGNIYSERSYMEWSKTPMVPPSHGEQFILMLVDPQSKADASVRFSCPSIGRHASTEGNVKAILDALSTAKQSGG